MLLMSATVSGPRIQTGAGRSMNSALFKRNDWHSLQKQALVSTPRADWTLAPSVSLTRGLSQ